MRHSMIAMMMLLCVLFVGECAWGENVVLDFDDHWSEGYWPGSAIPPNSRLSDDYLETYGVRFRSENNDYVAVVNMGWGHAVSGANAIAAASSDNLVDYSESILISFFDPDSPLVPGVTDFVSIQGDLDNDSRQWMELIAYDLAGEIIAMDTGWDDGPATLSVSAPEIHSVKFTGDFSHGGGIGMDNLTFSPIPEPSTFVLLLTAAGLLAVAWRRRIAPLLERGVIMKRPMIVMTLVMCAVQVAVADSLIVNGSFEDGPRFANDRLTLWAGDTSIVGWEVTGHNIDLVWGEFGTLWPASEGEYSLDLEGAWGDEDWGGIKQAFPTVAGQQYAVTFDMAGNPDPVPEMKVLEVSAAGQSDLFSFDNSGSTYQDIGWLAKQWEFTATDTTTTLEFLSIAPRSSWGAALDNVSVTAVPEPSTFILLAMGLLAVYCRREVTGK